jgi:hypothetical protein
VNKAKFENVGIWRFENEKGRRKSATLLIYSVFIDPLGEANGNELCETFNANS